VVAPTPDTVAPDLASSNTAVPFAAQGQVLPDARLQAILCNSAQRAEFFPIVTPLKADAWACCIEQTGLGERFGDVLDGIRYGFSHGLDISCRVKKTYIPHNLKSALKHPDVISAYIEKEQALGRISIGYEPVFLETKIGPFRCSPVGCVQKDPPNGKWRMFNHHSFPPFRMTTQKSRPLILRSTRTTGDRLRSATLSWQEHRPVRRRVSIYRQCGDTANKVIQASVLDVKSMFRLVLSTPEDRTQLMLEWNGKVMLDNMFSFGARPAPGVFGRLADLIVYLLKFMSIDEIIKWVDDFVFFWYPNGKSGGKFVYKYDKKVFFKVSEELGWIWEASKHTPFSFLFVYIGFCWDMENKTVEQLV
jgi:hypothetical protein